MSDFACRCSEESAAECDAALAWAFEFLSNKWTTVTKENLLTMVAHRLNWNYHASIDGIYADQWLGIASSTFGHPDGEEPAFGTFIQCDQAEDGLAFTLKAYYDKYGDERENWFNR